MVIDDNLRERGILAFCKLYSPQDFDVIKHHMPKFVDDQDGELFNEYFDFLQSLYALRGHIYELKSEDHLDLILSRLNFLADKFKFPKHIIRAFS